MRGCNGASVLSIGAMLLLGGASGSCDDPPAEPEAPAVAVEIEPLVEEAPAPGIRLEPASPRAGEPVKITGGPISFMNGCQGIASVDAKVEGQTITVTWTAKQVAKDAVCSMMLHADPVVATVESLEPGSYSVTFLPSGGTGSFVVLGGTEPAKPTE